MELNKELTDEFKFLRDFKRYINDNNLAQNIFNSYGNDECIININDIIKVFKVSNDKIDEFLSNFKSAIVYITDLNRKINSEQTEEIKQSSDESDLSDDSEIDEEVVVTKKENISFYYEVKVENDIETIFISGAGLSVLISESKEEHFDDTNSFKRFILIPSQLASCAFKAAKMEYSIKKSILTSN